MKEIKFEVLKINNEDVVTTSGYACANKYHLSIEDVDNSAGKEKCILLKDNGSFDLGDRVTTKPSELNSDTGYMSNDGGYDWYYVDLGSAGLAKYDLFYWNGSTWSVCPCEDKHPR